MSARHQAKCQSQGSERTKCSGEEERKHCGERLSRLSESGKDHASGGAEERDCLAEAAADKLQQVDKVTGGGQMLSPVRHPERLQLPPEVGV